MVSYLSLSIDKISTPKRYPFVFPNSSIGELRQKIKETKARILPVVYDERTLKLVGIIRRGSLLSITSTKTKATAKDLVEDPPLVFGLSDDAYRVAKMMISIDEWYAPVVDSKRRLLGIVGLEDILRYLLEVEHPILEEPVENFMTRDVIFVEPTTPIYKVWQLMLSKKFAALPVVKKKKIVGVIAEYDLITRGFTRPDLEAGSHRKGPVVQEVMSTPPVVVSPDSMLEEAVETMLDRDIGRVYVVEKNNILVGVVDRSDPIIRWLGYTKGE